MFYGSDLFSACSSELEEATRIEKLASVDGRM
jgi:hypothetical protein